MIYHLLSTACSREGEEPFLIAEIPRDLLFHEKRWRVFGSQELAREIERFFQEAAEWKYKEAFS